MDMKERKEKMMLDINRSVNFGLQSIYIAVPKTGSTSIRKQISIKEAPQIMIKGPHFTIMQIRDMLYLYYLATRKKTHIFPTNPKQILSDAELRAKADETFKKFFKFSSVRNPWARTVSLYYRKDGNRKKPDYDFDEFCEQLRFASDTCVFSTRCENQLDWMIDETGALAVDYVLRLEKFKEGLQEIRERTNGRLDLEEIHSNRNPQSQSSSYRSLYTKKTKNLVAELFKRDIEFFGYDF